MILSLRQIRRRIRSVQNTKKITRAMEMVAAAKLRRFQELLEKTRPYQMEMDRILLNLLEDQPALRHPLLEVRRESKILLIVMASDAGLCGTYNSNVLNLSQRYLDDQTGGKTDLIPIGRAAYNLFRKRGRSILNHFIEVRVGNFESILEKTVELAKDAFLTGTSDVVYVASTRFYSLSNQKPEIERLLPISVPPPKEQAPPTRYLLEPNAKRVFEELLPRSLYSRMKRILLEALVSEQISRMMAMRQATDNAEEMIEELTRLRNKARQTSITKEIIEVVSSARSLRR